MIVKPSISFLRTDSDAELVGHINKIYTWTTGNLSYPKAVALLLLVKAALDAFVAAMSAAGNGGTVLKSIKNGKRLALCALVRSLALDVTDECGGDMTVLLSSGFPVQNPQNFPIGDLPTPGAPVLSLGLHSGDLNASTDPIHGALTYNWQLVATSAPTVILQSIETSAANVSFAGITAGMICQVIVNAVGTAGTSDWSGGTNQMVI